MTTSKQVKKYVTELFADGNPHSTKEIKQYITAHGINLSPDSSLLRNLLHVMKTEDKNIVNVERGVYQQMHPIHNHNQNVTELVNAIDIIESNLLECRNFNWYHCSDEQLKVARSKVQMLIKLSNTISEELIQ